MFGTTYLYNKTTMINTLSHTIHNKKTNDKRETNSNKAITLFLKAHKKTTTNNKQIQILSS